MKTIELIQGTPAWHAHRLQHHNASDAPAMLGCSPYKSRTQLLTEMKTGLSPEVDGATQRRFDDGHRFEALARPLAEQIVGEDLYPVVGTLGKLSASFDGLTMAEDTAFEHKSLNSQLKAALMSDAGADALPKAYRVQMEQQCMVSGAERVLFMASKWAGDTLVEEVHAWYEPDAELRAEIIAGWAQFAIDLAVFEPQAAVPAVSAAAIESLPAVSVRLEGQLAVVSNLPEFGTALRGFIAGMVAKPATDQEFADAEAECKALKKAEEAIDAADEYSLASLTDVAAARTLMADLRNLARTTRLAREKIVAAEKDNRRLAIVQGAVKAYAAYIAALNQRLGRPYMPAAPVDFAGTIKGKKNLDSMQDAVDAALAQAKIAANATADRIDANLKHLNAEAGEYLALFPDVAALVLKEPQDFEAQVQFRVAEQRRRDEQRAEAARERIREEERVKAEAKARAEAEAARRAEEAADAAKRADAIASEQAAQAGIAEARQTDALSAPLLDDLSTLAADQRADVVSSIDTKRVIADAKESAGGPPTLSIGQIGTRLGFTVPAAFLQSLGFEPTRARGAVLFHDEDFERICDALIAHIDAIKSPVGQSA